MGGTGCDGYGVFCGGGGLAGGGRGVGVQYPFRDVAVHVVNAPWVWFFGACSLVLILSVVVVPGVVGELVFRIAEGVGGRGAGTAGVFPFRFCGEPIVFSCLGTEPFAEFGGGVVGHGDGGEAFFVAVTHAEVHGGVGGGRLADIVLQFISESGFQGASVLGAGASVVHEALVEFPWNFNGGYPEGGKGDLTLGGFV